MGGAPRRRKDKVPLQLVNGLCDSWEVSWPRRAGTSQNTVNNRADLHCITAYNSLAAVFINFNNGLGGNHHERPCWGIGNVRHWVKSEHHSLHAFKALECQTRLTVMHCRVGRFDRKNLKFKRDGVFSGIGKLTLSDLTLNPDALNSLGLPVPSTTCTFSVLTSPPPDSLPRGPRGPYSGATMPQQRVSLTTYRLISRC